jgi:hypothetical protein
MRFIKAEVSRYVDDEPQPGIVECVFVDAGGQSHFFIEKTAVVSSQNLQATSTYPIACELACEVEAEWNDQDGNSFARACTERPWGIESVTGESRFVVRSSQLSRDDSDA